MSAKFPRGGGSRTFFSSKSSYSMTVKLPTEQLYSLIGDCTGLSESTLLKISHCWKSHAPLKVFIYFYEKARQSGPRITMYP